MSAILETRDLAVSFGDRLVLDGITFALAAGQVAVVEGASGGGKSAFLRALAWLTPIVRGTVLVDGVDVRTVAPSIHRTHVAYVPQLPVMFAGTVADNVRAGPRLTGTELGDVRVAELLARVALGPEIAGRAARELSGGERQRVAIARSLANGPRIVLLDEPTASLDPSAAAAVLQVVRDLATGGRAVVVVTHVREHADAVGGARYVCEAGRLRMQSA